MSAEQRMHTPSGIYRLLTEKQQLEKEDSRKKANEHANRLKWMDLTGTLLFYCMGVGLALLESGKTWYDLKNPFLICTALGWGLFFYGYLSFIQNFQKFSGFSKIQAGVLSSCLFLAFGWVNALLMTRAFGILAVLGLVFALWVWRSHRVEQKNWNVFLETTLIKEGILNLKKGTIAEHRIHPGFHPGHPEILRNQMRAWDLVFYLGAVIGAAMINHQNPLFGWGDFTILMALYCLFLAWSVKGLRSFVQARWIFGWERQNNRVMYLEGHEPDTETLNGHL